MGVYKKFSPELYKQYDDLGINAVLTYLDSLGIYAKRGADKYGVDIVVYSGFRPLAYIEVEVAARWPGGTDWSFPDYHVLQRKAKFMRGQLGLPCTLYALRADLTLAIVIPDHAITEDLLVEVPNKFVAEGEMMYAVPLDRIEFIDIVALSEHST